MIGVVQLDELIPQLFVGFNPGRIDGNGIVDGANQLASRGFVMADALCAVCWVNLIDFRTHGNCLIRTFRLAHVAIDAFTSDQQGHNFSYLKLEYSQQRRIIPL